MPLARATCQPGTQLPATLSVRRRSHAALCTAARCPLSIATRAPLPQPASRGHQKTRGTLAPRRMCHISPETRSGDCSFTRAMSLSLGDAGVASARKTFSTARVVVPERRLEPAFTRQL